MWCVVIHRCPTDDLLTDFTWVGVGAHEVYGDSSLPYCGVFIDDYADSAVIGNVAFVVSDWAGAGEHGG